MSMQNQTSQQANRFPTRKGFTIVEMMVTIGILVLVTAGVATIFNTLGDTVSKGRKLSELNQFAARLERVMREDFEGMTRDGFLVIVNKNANQGQDVLLYRGEKSDLDIGISPGPGQLRRSDEILFFRNGEFETARKAISPDMIAKSHEAAIYYGHGQKRPPELTNVNGPTNLFFNPQPWDSNYTNPMGIDAWVGANNPGQLNPNEFAQDWSLLRHVTLLVNPRGPGQHVPAELFGLDRNNFGGTDRSFLEDSPRQYALQPAARSIFTSLSGSDPTENHRWLFDNLVDGEPTYPHFRTSGLVDIVTEDLATIRGLVQSLAVTTPPTTYFDYDPSLTGVAPIIDDRDQFEQNIYWGSPSAPNPSDANTLNLSQLLQSQRIRQWMIDALPSRWDLRPNPPVFNSGVRYEDIPTRLLFEDGDFTPGNDEDDKRRAYAEANQEMLGASVFIPHCSEFIVEWSYGFVDHSLADTDPDFKKLMWYGLDRYVDSDRDGVLDSANDLRAAEPYQPRTPTEAGNDPTIIPASASARTLGMNRAIVLGSGPLPTAPSAVEIATFGFMDPNGTAIDPSDDTVWQWPKLIRVTMSLADPQDRGVEQTYQVIFELPELE